VFVDLRDNYGITQLVCADELAAALSDVRVESVIMVRGKVVERAEQVRNSKMATGDVEVQVEQVTVLSRASALPFQIAEDDNAPEHLRLKHRFLELRRQRLHRTILTRSAVIKKIREIMHELEFVEFHTPILTSSSPEGARDYLVPSRIHPGRFFALPQAPQQFKQLLMVAGFDRYFQIAPCFRDEDPRADRSPGEFYQLDLEMSFVEQDDVFRVGEELFPRLFRAFSNWTVTDGQFPRIRYADAIERFGSDKPDLRISQELVTVTDIFRETNAQILRHCIEERGDVIALSFPLRDVLSRRTIEEFIDYYKGITGAGLGYILVTPEETKGSFAKVLSQSELEAVCSHARGELGANGTAYYITFIAAGPATKTRLALGKLRLKVASYLELIEKQSYRFCWIVDFPMFEANETTGAIEFAHNPFSMPQGGLAAVEEKSPLDLVAFQYDIVCNGMELSSGAIRNHEPEIMYRLFEIAGYSRETVDDKFGGMIRAFNLGAPPHGGMAPGVERMIMLLTESTTIREVVPFPMAQSVEDLMMGAPSSVTDLQLRELGLQFTQEFLLKRELALKS
jgi:aspartyl-tRNA synthetase